MALYRAVSQQEKENFEIDRILRNGNGMLEVKQFFKDRNAISEFVSSAYYYDYDSPYEHLFTIHLEDVCFKALTLEHMVLDGFDAITIYEDFLSNFNSCIISVEIDLLL